jgi:glycosyltransferase involved in cell wall biosynthesis
VKRIVIDYSTTFYSQGPPTGIPRTVESISDAIVETCEHEVCFVVVNEKERSFAFLSSDKEKILNLYMPQMNDIFICPGAPWAFEEYISIIKSIESSVFSLKVIIHDLIPYLFPHFYENPDFGSYYFNFVTQLVSHASSIYCNSECTKKDLLTNIKLPSLERKTSVIRLGNDFNRNKRVDGDCDLKLNRFKNNILCVGTIEFRKNQFFLLKAYKRFILENRTAPDLLIIGKIGYLNNQIIHHISEDPILKSRVKILDYVNDDELAYLYANCLFTVYPSLYEGWGLPISESLMYGKNVICSNTSSMVEIAPDLCHFADPLNLRTWCQLILLLSSDKSYRQLNEQKIVDQYNAVTWQNTASSLLNILK